MSVHGMRLVKPQRLISRLVNSRVAVRSGSIINRTSYHSKNFSTAAANHTTPITPVVESTNQSNSQSSSSVISENAQVESQSSDEPSAETSNGSPVIIDLTAANIHQFLESDKPVLIDCWASWCEPCRQLTPLLEQVVQSRNGAVLLGKLNVDTESALIEAMQLPVESIPAIFIALDGQFIGSWTGLKPLQEINAIIDKVMEVAQQRTEIANKKAAEASKQSENPASSQKPVEATPVEAPAPMKADEMLAGAEQAFEAGDYERAASLYSTLFASASVSKEHRAMQARAAAGLTQSLVHEHTRTGNKQLLLQARSFVDTVDEACRSDRTLANQCKGCAELEVARRAIALAEQLDAALSSDVSVVEADASKGDLDAMHKFVLLRFQGGQIDTAIDLALKLLKKDKTRGRELLLMILDRIGLESPLAVTTRKRMAQIMF